MISEHSYMELLRGCIKWNSRTMEDRKKRLRYPFYDQQTGTAQRETHFAVRGLDHRYSSNDVNTVVQYATERWKKPKDAPPADAIEVKMFLRDNPALDAAVNQTSTQGMSNNDVGSENSNDSFTQNVKERSSRHVTMKEDYRDELMLDDDLSPDENGSDEDDWSTKKRRRGGMTGGRSGGRRKVSNNRSSIRPMHQPQPPTTSSVPIQNMTREQTVKQSTDDKPHVCDKCNARYKSLAGLSYHLAYCHDLPSTHPTSKLLSSNIEISNYCDICVGNNKPSKQEDLVTCHDCGRSGHPSCLSFNNNVPVIIGRYGWQCIECKSCTICGTSENDDKLLFCDDCDRGYHLYCLRPALEKAPDDEYSCRLCQIEFGEKASAPKLKS